MEIKIPTQYELPDVIAALEEACHEISAREILVSDMELAIEACERVIGAIDSTPGQVIKAVKLKGQALITLRRLKAIH